MTAPYTFFCREHGPSETPCKCWVDHEVLRLLKKELNLNRAMFLEIIHLLNVLCSKLVYPSGMEVKFKENQMSTPAGGSSTFQETPTPAGSIFPSGTTFTWTVDDTADITLAPNPAAPTDTTQIQATCVASPTGTAYNLTCTSSYTPPGAPTPISATINVPITPAGPTTPTGMTIAQTS